MIDVTVSDLVNDSTFVPEIRDTIVERGLEDEGLLILAIVTENEVLVEIEGREHWMTVWEDRNVQFKRVLLSR